MRFLKMFALACACALFVISMALTAGEETPPLPLPDQPGNAGEKPDKTDPAAGKAEKKKKSTDRNAAKPEKKRDKKEKKRRKGHPLIVSPGGRLSPVDIAHFSIAHILMQRGEVEETLTELAVVTLKSPNRDARGAAWFSMGNIQLLKLKNPDEAIKCYARVEGRLANQAKGRVLKLLMHNKSYAEAVEILEKLAAEAADKNQEATLRLALALFHQKNNNLDAALAELKKVAAMNYRDVRPQKAPDPKKRKSAEPRKGKSDKKKSEKRREKAGKAEKKKENVPENPNNPPQNKPEGEFR